jgi:hypothetical protein
MVFKNKIFRQLLNNLKEIKEQKWTSVAMDFREEFIALANAFDVYPCGGAFLDDMSAQVFYID